MIKMAMSDLVERYDLKYMGTDDTAWYCKNLGLDNQYDIYIGLEGSEFFFDITDEIGEVIKGGTFPTVQTLVEDGLNTAIQELGWPLAE